MQWKLKLKWAFACVKEGVKACQDALCTYVPSKRWFGKFAQIGPEKKCPRVPVWVRGGGCNRYLGNAQIEGTLISVGLPLRAMPKCLRREFQWCFPSFESDLLEASQSFRIRRSRDQSANQDQTMFDRTSEPQNPDGSGSCQMKQLSFHFYHMRWHKNIRGRKTTMKEEREPVIFCDWVSVNQLHFSQTDRSHRLVLNTIL